MSDTTYDPNNIFAKIMAGDIPCHKVYEDQKSFVFMDIMPASHGHCLVIPKAPSRNILDCSEDDLATTMAIVKKISKAAVRALNADGVTIRQNNESAGGQVVFHTHFHVMPRYEGEKLIHNNPNQADHGELAELAAKIAAAVE